MIISSRSCPANNLAGCVLKRVLTLLKDRSTIHEITRNSTNYVRVRFRVISWIVSPTGILLISPSTSLEPLAEHSYRDLRA